MAPLPPSQHDQIEAMIQSGLGTKIIADTIGCSDRAIRKIRMNLRLFGTTTAPPNRVGRHRITTPMMQDALFEKLLEQPDMFQSEMSAFLYDRFEVEVSLSSIGRLLKAAGWTRKTSRRVAKQREPELRDLYLYKLSDCVSYQMIYIDESGSDKRDGHRSKGWAPKGVTPVQVGKFNREKRFQILAAYTQEGVELARIYPGSTDTEIFTDFIDQLLHCCGKWPEPKSVLIMDNATIHRSEKIQQLCAEAGVKLLYLPPYSPDMNPIEEFFAEVKNFVKKPGPELVELFKKDFMAFLTTCVEIVGKRICSAEGHFRHAGITIEQPLE